MFETSSLIYQAIMLVSFCAMIVDGNIDKREVDFNEVIFRESPAAEETHYAKMANYYIDAVNADPDAFMEGYFNALEENPLSKEEKISLFGIADSLIRADGEITEKEIQFLMLTKAQLGLKNEEVMSEFPKLELFHEKRGGDEAAEETAIRKFVKSLDLPKFSHLNE